MSPLTHPPLSARRSERRESAGPDAGQGGGLAGLLWLTWRQHRWALIGSVVLTAALAGWMTYLASDLMSIYHQCHDTMCPDSSVQEARLTASFGPFRIANDLLQFVEFLPLLIGMFLGVPLLAREHEQRTLLLAWSQDVSPMRWLWTKVAVLGLVVAALTTAFSVASTRVAHAMADVSAGGLFSGSMFLDSGMLPLAAGLCWFAIGLALGAAVRRVLPAAVAVIVGFIGLLYFVEWRYPTLMTPMSRFQAVGAPDDPGGALGINDLRIKGGISVGADRVTNLYDSSRHALDYTRLRAVCPDLGPGSLPDCMVRHHFLTFVQYQPASRIGDFHLILATGYLSLGVLALAALWLLVRRTSLSAG
ncbi:hypothetical protein AB0M29_23230 [Streptomyces sp. NPDC051976]|uniref:ABC transporter permease n=1 Tax=Streptomyces sp. NPDC051976 TaxID=3154947 RepID=UPI00344614F0